MPVGRVVVDIPVEGQASSKALEIALAYDKLVPRASYTWVLYARNGMSFSQLESFRARIIGAAQRWQVAHGLPSELFGLIVELARAGVIWKPVSDVPELQAETFWLWKNMGFDAIKRDALAAGGIAIREEAALIRNRVALLDRIVDLPAKIVMTSVEAAIAKAKPLLALYVEERNKTVQLIQGDYPRFSKSMQDRSDNMIRVIQTNDRKINAGLAKLDMSLKDFGKPITAVTLGVVIAVTTGTIIVATIIGVVSLAILTYIVFRRDAGKEALKAAVEVRGNEYERIEKERRAKIAALSPELSAQERDVRVAEIDAEAARQRVAVANEAAKKIEEIRRQIAAAKRPFLGIPWYGWLGISAITIPLGIYALSKIAARSSKGRRKVSPRRLPAPT